MQQYGSSEELHRFDKIGTRYYDFNCSNEYLSDPRVRRALSMGLSRQTICDAVFSSKPQRAYAFVPYGTPTRARARTSAPP